MSSRQQARPRRSDQSPSRGVREDQERLARFETEAKLLASLNHPNIASIYGLEESNGVKARVLEMAARWERQYWAHLG